MKRKIIPVEIWMTEEFTVVPRVGLARNQQRSRSTAALLLQKIQAAHARRFGTR